MTTLRQRWAAWTAANLDRCPHETGLIAARRRAAGEEPECTALTVAHLRPGVLVLAALDATGVDPGRFSFGTTGRIATGRWACVVRMYHSWRPAFGPVAVSDHELRVLP